MKNCCDSNKEKFLTNISVVNNGLSAKTFRLYGGGTGLPSVDNNDDTYSVANLVTSPGESEIAQVPGGYLYVSSGGSNFVSVINPADFSLVANIDISAGSLGIAYCPINNNIYVACGLGVAVIDTSNNTLLTTIAAGSGFFITFCTSNNMFYVSDANANNVYTIDPSTNTFGANITLPGAPGDPIQIEYRPENDTVYCLDVNATPPTLYYIDPGTNIATGITLPTGDDVRMVYAASNQCYYISSRVFGRIHVVDTNTNTYVTSILGVGVSPFWSGYANNFVYVPCQASNYVAVISTQSNTVVTTVPTGTNPRFATYNPTDGNMYVTNFVSMTATLIASPANTVTTTITLDPGGAPQRPFYAEDTFMYIGNSGTSVDRISFSENVVITVNGGQITLDGLNRDTLANPICVCELSVNAINFSTFSTPMEKILKSSNGEIHSDDINFLAKYSAYFEQNKVVIPGKELDTCVLDGFNYLQWSVPAGETLNIDVKYCQYSRSEMVEGNGPYQGEEITKKPLKKKYIHAGFKYFIQ